jgi:hypothetical protein
VVPSLRFRPPPARADTRSDYEKEHEVMSVLIDCDSCAARDRACSDCVVSALLNPPAGAAVDLDTDEQRALGALASGGLLPPLRLVSSWAAVVHTERGSAIA